MKRLDVKHFPHELEPEILYVSEDYSIAVHLCPCGCLAKIYTPVNSSIGTSWTLSEGPTLNPSVLTNFPCKSHYWIRDGAVVWA